MTNRFNYEFTESENPKLKLKYFYRVIQHFCSQENNYLLVDLDIEHFIIVFKNIVTKRHIYIGFYVEFGSYYYLKDKFIDGNHDNPKGLFEYYNNFLIEVDNHKKTRNETKFNFPPNSILDFITEFSIVTNLNFKFLPTQVLEKLPENIQFHQMENIIGLPKLRMKEISPNKSDLIKMAQNTEYKIREIQKLGKYRSYSTQRKTVSDDESSIMNMLRNGEGDTIGF